MKNAPPAQLAALTASELSREIAGGNTTAFEEFYRRFAPRVYGLLMTLTNANDDLARELLQVVMLRVARKFKQASSDDRMWGWLATVTRNAVIDHVRSDERRRRREQSATVAAVPDSIAEGSGRSDEILTAALQEAMAELSADEQALIRSFYYDNKPQAVIAENNETTVKALQSRLARIRRRLKESLTRVREHES
jgi:RNA polymerase sigma-70 factor (ECF subfamily)